MPETFQALHSAHQNPFLSTREEYVESKVRQKLDKHYNLLVNPRVTTSDYEIKCIKTLNRSVKETIRRYEDLMDRKLTLSFNAALPIN